MGPKVTLQTPASSLVETALAPLARHGSSRLRDEPERQVGRHAPPARQWVFRGGPWVRYRVDERMTKSRPHSIKDNRGPRDGMLIKLMLLGFHSVACFQQFILWTRAKSLLVNRRRSGPPNPARAPVVWAGEPWPRSTYPHEVRRAYQRGEPPGRLQRGLRRYPAGRWRAGEKGGRNSFCGWISPERPG